MYQRPTFPLSIGGVLDDGFRLLRASLPGIFGLSLAGAAIGNLPNLIVADTYPDPAALFAGGAGIAMLLLVPLNLIIFGAVVARIGAVTDNTAMPLGAALGIGARRLLPLIGWVILYVVACLLGFLLLLVPGVILALSLSFGAYLVINDGMGPIDALRASHRLVWGSWWRTAVIMTVIIFIIGAAYVLLGLMGGVGAAMDAHILTSSYATIAITMLVTAIISPVSYCFSIAVLNDLKLRKQGADLEQRIEAIAGA